MVQLQHCKKEYWIENKCGHIERIGDPDPNLSGAATTYLSHSFMDDEIRGSNRSINFDYFLAKMIN